MDSACQTLKPQCVLDAEREYATTYGACGGRVHYTWGKKVDAKVREAREELLALCGKSAKEYCVIFTLNTTYGINLILHQLQNAAYERIVTSDIEHNSVLLPCMALAKRSQKPLTILPRDTDGSLLYEKADIQGAVVVVNSMSNIDGRRLCNAAVLAKDAHSAGGLLLLDAAQGFAHDTALLRDTDFDAAFGSGHKMHGPSLGFVVLRRNLMDAIDPFFIGGGNVTDVTMDSYTLAREAQEPQAFLEPGLQNWSGIVGLHAALQWRASLKGAHEAVERMADTLFAELAAMPRVQLFNTHASPVLSMSVDGIDAHDLAMYLSEAKVMCRSGYFCCHRYLLHQRALPPLLRVSLALHNTSQDADRFLSALRTILSTL